ncbi:MAG: DsbE family thiol:disulfide interchange protein [Kiloniellales bacterium]
MLRRWLFLLPVVVFAVVAGYFVWGLDPSRDPRAVPSALVNEPVPDFELPPIEGMDVPGLATADLGNGEVSLVNFFASWCIPCKYEHPLLMKLADDRAARIIGINYRDKPENARRWLTQLGNPYERIGADENGRVAIDWGLSGVPETFVIDRDGHIRYQQIGPITPQDLNRIILPMIEELSR